tara:strand:+ start:94 stop:519 length:426 start_codon:yes stop_codon:yes gene_type:complete
MSDARSRLAEWFEEFWGEQLPIGDDIDLFERFGIEGDDASGFMDSFAAHFDVDGQDYRSYFHHRDEGTNFGALFFAPPYRRVQRIPITPDMLVKAIETKRWPLTYPPHEVPAVRWDRRVNQFLLVVPVVLLALWLWKRLVS